MNRAVRPQPDKWVFDRKLPKDVAFERHLYRITSSDNENFSFEEDIMTKIIDTPFSILYEKLLAKGVENISKQDKKNFAFYLSSFQPRNPRILRSIFEKQFEECSEVPENLEEIAISIGARFSDKDIERWPEIAETLKGMFKSKEDFGKFLMMAVLKTSLEEAAEKLLETTWMVVKINPRYSPVITTDYPMVSMGGFGNDDTVYVFPLSPCEVLVMKKKHDLFEMMNEWSETQTLSFLNMIILGHAKEVYYKNKGHEKFIKKFLGCLIDIPIFMNRDTYFQKILKDTFDYVPMYINDMNIGLGINNFD